MPILAFFGSFLFFVPLTSAFFARSQGRNFWKWFAIGCVLPIISVFILWFLPAVKEEDRAGDPFLALQRKMKR